MKLPDYQFTILKKMIKCLNLPTLQLCNTDTSKRCRIVYRIRIRYGYVFDTASVRILRVSDFYLILGILSTRSDTYPTCGYGPAQGSSPPSRHPGELAPAVRGGSSSRASLGARPCRRRAPTARPGELVLLRAGGSKSSSAPLSSTSFTPLRAGGRAHPPPSHQRSELEWRRAELGSRVDPSGGARWRRPAGGAQVEAAGA